LAWYYAIRQIIRYPLFGMGIYVWKDWYANVVPMRFLYAEHPHNLYLKILVELGLLGFIPYFWIIGSILRRFYRSCVKAKPGNLDFMVLLSLLMILLSCMTDVFVQQFSVSLVFWFSLGFMWWRSKMKGENEGI
jgi:O-antigen ligase